MRVLKFVAASVAVLLLVLLVWGRIEPYTLDVEEHEAVIPGLPASWEGRRVALASDWQLGMWLDNSSTVREAVSQIIEAKPAAVLLGGDFLYHAGGDADEVVRHAAELARPLVAEGLSVYAVLGNHDYAVSGEGQTPNEEIADRLVRGLQEAGVRVLHNESLALPPPETTADTAANRPLYLIGIGPEWPDKSDVDQALANVPDDAPRLVMHHNPNTFTSLPAGAAPLAVAGHTHGGQIRLPLLPEWSYLTLIRPGYVTVDGWIEKYDVQGNQLYVNRGIGMGVVPLRINCKPELTLFTLVGA